MFPQAAYYDDRGQFIDKLTLCVPIGFFDVVRQAAAREFLFLAEFVRRAVLDRVAAAGQEGCDE